MVIDNKILFPLKKNNGWKKRKEKKRNKTREERKKCAVTPDPQTRAAMLARLLGAAYARKSGRHFHMGIQQYCQHKRLVPALWLSKSVLEIHSGRVDWGCRAGQCTHVLSSAVFRAQSMAASLNKRPRNAWALESGIYKGRVEGKIPEPVELNHQN